MERQVWITSINKVRQDIVKSNQGNEASRNKSMAITKLDEALLWLHKAAVDVHIDKVARGESGAFAGEEQNEE